MAPPYCSIILVYPLCLKNTFCHKNTILFSNFRYKFIDYSTKVKDDSCQFLNAIIFCDNVTINYSYSLHYHQKASSRSCMREYGKLKNQSVYL